MDNDMNYNKVPAFMHESVRLIVRFFRGLVALLDPTPGRLGSGSPDVDFISPVAAVSAQSARSCPFM